MNRTVFVHISPIRLLVVLGGLLLIVTAVPAVAQATPQRHPVVGSSGSADLLSFERSEGIGYQVTVEGNDITYRATGVPRVVVLPGSCATAVVDVLRALPVLGPDILAVLRGADPDIAALLEKVIANNLITRLDPIRVADREGTATHTFTDLPRGFYAVLTVCNGSRDLYGVATVVIAGDGNGSFGS